jgi:hypothetical protein
VVKRERWWPVRAHAAPLAVAASAVITAASK